MEKSYHTMPFLASCFLYLSFLYLYLFDHISAWYFVLFLLLLVIGNFIYIFVALDIRILRRTFIITTVFSFVLLVFEFPTTKYEIVEVIYKFYTPTEEIVVGSGIHIISIAEYQKYKNEKITYFDDTVLLKVEPVSNIIRYESKSVALIHNFLNKKNSYDEMKENVNYFIDKEHTEIHNYFYRKDVGGDSAGLALVLSYLSIEPTWKNKLSIGVTGAINKDGKVLFVGGIKEKIQIATRYGHTHMIVPTSNLKEALKAKEELNLPIEVQGVKNLDEALAIIKEWNTN
ncbi:S16 family serine protease [Sutcliffiella rhizosphaerae]|uniref:Lon protease n=1 Tax=Sutcliffiella rhizosphaerae TaxID=2880967 RepID=A0ABM8YR90_9BACI|nr:S16 family serine protease [Sutcliffiella rhizosphaerae]CAG9622492.1 Lon protease [Sutcliffiella rhizosphaerae]